MPGAWFHEEDARRIDQQIHDLMFGVNNVHNVQHAFGYHQVGNNNVLRAFCGKLLTSVLGLFFFIADQRHAAAVLQNQLSRFEAYVAGTVYYSFAGKALSRTTCPSPCDAVNYATNRI